MDLVYLINEMSKAMLKVFCGNEEYKEKIDVIGNKMCNIIHKIIEWHVVGYIEEYYPEIKDRDIIDRILLRTLIHIFGKINTYINAFLLHHSIYVLQEAIHFAFATDNVDEVCDYLTGCRYVIKYGIFRTVDRLIKEVMSNE